MPATLLRALVVEDEWPARNYLVELIEASGLAEVIGAVGSVGEAKEVLAGAPGAVEVAFVDVQLDGGGSRESGLALVRAMAPSAGAPWFVLATAHAQHAVEAFELGVVDYLLKPFSEERVVQCLERVKKRGAATSPARAALRIVARKKKSLVFLEPAEIWAFEAADRLTFVHTLHGRFDIDLSLAAVEASFGRAFVRTHRNWLVNAEHVKELEREGQETRLFVGAKIGAGEGLSVPVARERAAAVRELLLANTTGLKKP